MEDVARLAEAVGGGGGAGTELGGGAGRPRRRGGGGGTCRSHGNVGSLSQPGARAPKNPLLRPRVFSIFG